MSAKQAVGAVIATSILALPWGCSEQTAPGRKGQEPARRAGLTELDAIDPSRIVAGQTIYVPAYSAVSVSDRALRYELAITLSVRNTDMKRPIVVTSVRYHDDDGRLVREFVKKPVQIAPLAAIEYFVKESDTSGGYSASFIVEWVADQPVSTPLAETLMAGIAGTQGISFTASGRVIADRTGPAPGASGPN